MPKYIDLLGQRFERLVVIRFVGTDNHRNVLWECQCDCGNKKITTGKCLKRGETVSCGCKRNENLERARKIKSENYIDLTGQKFGRLTVIEFMGRNKSGNSLWKCVCENDGNLTIVADSSLKNGNVKSCGCYNIEKVKESNSKEYGESNFNFLFSNYRRGALSRNLQFELDKDQFKNITQQDCYYCGCEPYQIFSNGGKNGVYIYNGIDRIDNNVGYTIKNCIPCCGRCNIARGKLSQEEFYDMIMEIYNNMNLGNKL